MTKRYAIKQLRVHTASCPLLLTKNCKLNCDDCNLYGDTKEQLIKKIEQAMKRRLLTDGTTVILPNNTHDYVSWERLAKEIVDFLGVEE